MIDPYVTVRPDVIAALGKLARGGGSMEVRANAARAVGILRGGAAVPDLVEAAHSKNTDVIFTNRWSRCRRSATNRPAPRIAFLLHDLDPKVQVAAIETTGLLRNQDAVPDLMDVLKRAKDAKVKRAALTRSPCCPTTGAVRFTSGT